MIKHIVVYYIYWICLVIFYLKTKTKTKNLTIEPLNVVTDVHVIFSILNIICLLKSGFWIAVLIFQEFWEDLFNNASKWGMFMYEQVS